MRTHTLLLVGLLLSLSGCTIEAKGLGAGPSQSALISGRVFDSEQNEPVKGATVKTTTTATVNGVATTTTITATTDDNGNFTIEASPGKTVITIEEADHAKGVKEVDVYADAESYVEVFAKPVTKDSTLDAVNGGTVKVGEMTLNLPPDGVETEDGTPYNGKVTIEVATVRPERASELSAFPGKFDGTTIGGMAGSVATRSAVAIHLRNAAGQPLHMRGNAQVEIFMPIRSAISQRNTRLWKLREASADWEEVGFQAVRDVDPITNEPALRSAVSALTWWNAGEPFVKSRIQGCLSLPSTGGTDVVPRGEDASIGSGAGAGGAFGMSGTGGASDGAGGAAPTPEDAGAPRMQAPLHGTSHLAGIQVVATGIGYGYFAEHYTNAEGCFDIEVKANGPVALYAQTRMLRSQARRFTAGAPGETQNIGMFALGARNGDCPGVMQDCGAGCVDTLSDNNNCGECGFACAGELPIDPAGTLVPYHCVYGSCGCDDSDGTQEDCGGACANIETDLANCGTCGNDCITNGTGDECIGSACGNGGTTTCPSGQVPCSDGSCADPAVGCTAVADCGPDPITGDPRISCPGSFGDPAMCIDTENDPNSCGGCVPAGNVNGGFAPRCWFMPNTSLGQNGCSTGCTNEAGCTATDECMGDTACGTATGELYCVAAFDTDQFCGSCRTSCTPEETCDGRSCIPRSGCGPNERPCGYGCLDVAIPCGTQCAQGAACSAGTCIGGGIGGTGGSGGTGGAGGGVAGMGAGGSGGTAGGTMACPAGFIDNGGGCVDIDECATNNGGCGLLPCVNLLGSFSCG